MESVPFVFVSLVALLVITSAQQNNEDHKAKIQKNREECTAETNVNPELIDRADKGDFVEDDNLKCFTKCFYQKAGFVDEKGELQIETIKAKIPDTVDKDKALKVIENCKQTGKDACETVYLVHKCYFEHTHRPDDKEEAKPGEKTSDKTEDTSDKTKKTE